MIFTIFVRRMQCVNDYNLLKMKKLQISKKGRGKALQYLLWKKQLNFRELNKLAQDHAVKGRVRIRNPETMLFTTTVPQADEVRHSSCFIIKYKWSWYHIIIYSIIPFLFSIFLLSTVANNFIHSFSLLLNYLLRLISHEWRYLGQGGQQRHSGCHILLLCVPNRHASWHRH